MWVTIKIIELYRVVDMRIKDNRKQEVEVLYSGINQEVVGIYDRLEDAQGELLTIDALGVQPPCFITRTYFVIEEFKRDDSECYKGMPTYKGL